MKAGINTPMLICTLLIIIFYAGVIVDYTPSRYIKKNTGVYDFFARRDPALCRHRRGYEIREVGMVRVDIRGKKK